VATTNFNRTINLGYTTTQGAGKYILEVRDSHAGRYNKQDYSPNKNERFGKYQLKVNPLASTTLILNNAVTGNVTNMLAYSFPAQTGQKFSVDFSSSFQPSWIQPRYQIADSNRQLVDVAYWGNPKTFTALVTGTYTVYVVNDSEVSSLPFSLLVSHLNP
jgi:hypothetical protein